MKNIIISALYLLILFGLAEFVFAPTYLFYEFWWLDIPMHILGGFGVASFTGAILAYTHKKISYKAVALSFLFVAIVWEVWEYYVSLTSFNIYAEWGGWFDTIKDIINGFIGMSIAYFFLRK